MNRFIVIIICFGIISCSRNNGDKIVGGTSDQGNAITVGIVVDQNGVIVENASVKLIPSNYLPHIGDVPDSLTTTTDSSGQYKFKSLDSGVFNLEVISSDLASTSLQRNIFIDGDTVNNLPLSTLSPSKSIAIYAPDSLANKSGYVYLAGTSVYTPVSNLNPLEEPIVLSGLSDSVVPQIIFVETGDVDVTILLEDVPLVSEDTTTYLNYSLISGIVVDNNGRGVPGVQVKLISENHNPIQNSTQTILLDTTDEEGHYHLAVEEQGRYNLEMISADSVFGNSILGLEITDNRTYGQPKIKLEKLSTLKIYIPEGFGKSMGYVYLQGTSRSSFFNIQNVYQEYTVIGQVVPQTTVDIRYSEEKNGFQIMYPSIAVSGDTVLLDPYFYWSHSQKFVINTTASGADVTEDLQGFPISLRLTRFNFDFSQANSDGSDIRIAGPGFTPKSIEIEYWDRQNNSALIWIKMDTVFGNNDQQGFTLHWGNGSASTMNPQIVFDTTNGFAGVWHLNEAGNSLSNGYIDKTQNQLHGTGFGLNSNSNENAILGTGTRFNGSNDYIQLVNSRIGALNFALNADITISAWARPDEIFGQFRPIFQKGKGQYALKLLSDGNWEINETQINSGWAVTKFPAKPNEWVHIVGVRKGLEQKLYLNGELVSDSVSVTEGINRNSDFDGFIGRNSHIPDRKWKGILDEVRISATNRSPQWIKLSFENQKRNSSVIVPVISQE